MVLNPINISRGLPIRYTASRIIGQFLSVVEEPRQVRKYLAKKRYSHRKISQKEVQYPVVPHLIFGAHHSKMRVILGSRLLQSLYDPAKDIYICAVVVVPL